MLEMTQIRDLLDRHRELAQAGLDAHPAIKAAEQCPEPGLNVHEGNRDHRNRCKLRPEHRGIVARHRAQHARDYEAALRSIMPGRAEPHDDFVGPDPERIGQPGGRELPDRS